MRSRKKTLKTILWVVVGILALFLIVGLFNPIVDEDGRVELNLQYEIGALDEQGKYKSSETTIYSEMFDCKGLNVELDFDAEVTYKIFYYDADGKFVFVSEELDDDYNVENSVEEAVQARIVIYPVSDDEDFKLNFFTKIKYANQLTVKVYEDQKTVEE